MSTTAKFSLDNPFYAWPKAPEMDVQILMNKLNDLRAEVSKDSWENLVLTEPNEILRKIESRKISVVFVFLNDLKHSVHVAHIPFLCRLSGTKLVVLKPGSAKELQSYFGSKNLFMFAVSKHDDTIKFSSHFSDIDPFNPNQLPQVSIKK